MPSFSGTAGNDTITPTLISVGVTTDPLGSFPSAASDTINGADGNDSLDGGNGNDFVSGGLGNDTIRGGGGNDTIIVQGGDDADGGSGDDLFQVASVIAGTVLAGGFGTDTFDAQGPLNVAAATLSGFEILALDSFDLTLTAPQLVQFTTIASDDGAATGSLILSGGAAFAATAVTQLTTLFVTGAASADNLAFTTSGPTVTDISVNSGGGDDAISTGAGNDTLSLGTGNDTGWGEAGNDSLVGGSGQDSLVGGAGDDTLIGGDVLADTLQGGNGNDSLDGVGGADQVSGGAGNDTIIVRSGANADGDEGDDTFRVVSAAAGTVIIGDLGTDRLTLSTSVDISAATVSGIETLALNASTLTLSQTQLLQVVTIEADGAATAGFLALTGATVGSTTNVTGLATLTVTGSSTQDSLTLTSTSTDIVFNGGAGNDVVSSGSVDDTLSGQDGNDTLLGNSGDDSLVGGNGNDSLVGGAGNDTLTGGAGNDTLSGGSSNDLLIAAAGDLANGGSGNDTLSLSGTGTFDGDDGDDVFEVSGIGAGTVLVGDIGTDVLDAQGAQDITGASLSGIENLALDASVLTLSVAQLNAFDNIVADGSATGGEITLSTSGVAGFVNVTGLATLRVNGTAGGDNLAFASNVALTAITVLADAGSDTIATGSGDDSLSGGNGNDSLTGNFGDDTLDGGEGNDTLLGLGDDDLLVGIGAGFDSMLGGFGNDTIQFGAGDNVNGESGDDRLEVSGNLAGAQTIRGGDGIDRLDPQFAVNFGTLAVFQGIEVLELDTNITTLTAAQLGSFSDLGADSGSTTGNVALSAGGFAAVGVTELATLNVTGSAGNDDLVLTPNGPTPTDILVDAGLGDDYIQTAAGDDTLIGGAGADRLLGMAGADSVDGGIGNDTVQGGDGATLRGGDNDDALQLTEDTTLATVLDGGSGTDTFDPQGIIVLGALTTFTSIERLALDVSLLTLSAAQLGSFGTIVSDNGAPAGNLALSAAGSVSISVDQLLQLTVTGSTGDDALSFNTIGATPTDMTVSGGAGNDTISLDDGDDSIDGGAGSDFLFGGGTVGRDTLAGGTGNDTLGFFDGGTASGGDGGDVLEVYESADPAAVSAIDGGAGLDTFDAQGTLALAAATTITGVERLALDTAALTLGAAQLESFTTIIADTGATVGVVILSSGGSATTALTGLETLNLTGSAAADLLVFTSGAGLPTAIVADLAGGNDLLSAGGGADAILGGAGSDTLVGNGGNDSLDGGFLGDSLVGGAGADTILGGGGADTMTGGLGGDLYGVDSIADVVDEAGGGGVDRVRSLITYTLGADIENLTLTGAGVINGTGHAGNNAMLGNGAANVLTGLGGDDSMNGAGGNDTLIGGEGADTLTGGAGSDVFLFFSPSEGIDRITGFAAADEIQIDDAGFAGLGLGALTAANFIAKAGAASTNPAGAAQIIYDTLTGDLWYDADGGGAVAGVQFATLGGIPGLAAGDIVVI